MDELVSQLNSIEILGVLERIKKVNYMIAMHQLHKENSMVKQFERQRVDFLEQLKNLLAQLQIDAKLKIKAVV